jgi:hypothetical protein
VALPVMLAGTQVAHSLAYRLVFPQAHVRVGVLAASGHGYLAWLPLVLAFAGAGALVGLGAAVLDAARGRVVRELQPLAFAVLPPLAFALQELLELSLHTGTFAWHAFAAPTFLPGLALQLPFAALAYLAARLLLRAAVRVGRLLARSPRVRAAGHRRTCGDLVAASPRLAVGGPRAPPLPVGI